MGRSEEDESELSADCGGRTEAGNGRWIAYRGYGTEDEWDDRERDANLPVFKKESDCNKIKQQEVEIQYYGWNNCVVHSECLV